MDWLRLKKMLSAEYCEDEVSENWLKKIKGKNILTVYDAETLVILKEKLCLSQILDKLFYLF